MAELPPVVNASPIILLHRISALWMLRAAADSLVVPEAVIVELAAARTALAKQLLPLRGFQSSFRLLHRQLSQGSILDPAKQLFLPGPNHTPVPWLFSTIAQHVKPHIGLVSVCAEQLDWCCSQNKGIRLSRPGRSLRI